MNRSVVREICVTRDDALGNVIWVLLKEKKQREHRGEQDVLQAIISACRRFDTPGIPSDSRLKIAHDLIERRYKLVLRDLGLCITFK